MRKKQEQELTAHLERGQKLAEEQRRKRVSVLLAQEQKWLEKRQEFEESEEQNNAFLTQGQLMEHESKMSQKAENHINHLQMRIATRAKYNQDVLNFFGIIHFDFIMLLFY